MSDETVSPRRGTGRRRTTIVVCALFSVVFVTTFAGSFIANGVQQVVPVTESVIVLTGLVASAVGLTLTTVVYLVVSRKGVSYVDVTVPVRYDVEVALAGAVTAVCVSGVVSGVSWVIGVSPGSSPVRPALTTASTTTAFLVGAATLVVIPVEEVFFRNIMQKRVTVAVRPWTAITITSWFFMLFHAPGVFATARPASAVVTLVSLFVVSVVFGVVYEETTSLPAVIITHTVYNVTHLLVVAVASTRFPLTVLY